jgi:SH3-like domain-containing protein
MQRWRAGAAAALLVLALPLAHAQAMVSVARDRINMRAGAGTQHEVLWMLSRGYPLKVIGRAGTWLRVRDFEGDRGWVYKPLTSTRPHHIVKVSVANIRSAPGRRSRIVGRARYGDVLRTLERRPGWVKVRADGAIGWVARPLLWGW